MVVEKIKAVSTQTNTDTDKKTDVYVVEQEFQEFLAPNMMAEELTSLTQDNLSSDFTDITLGIESNIKDLKADFCYDTLTIDKDDAEFFIGLVEKNEGQFSLSNNFTEVVSEVEGTQKTKSVTKTLSSMLETSMKTQKPMRLDFDNNVSVILRVDKEGKVSAEFIPGDKAVEQYLRNNIGYLRDRLDTQNISYNEVYYRQYKGNSNNKRNNKGE